MINDKDNRILELQLELSQLIDKSSTTLSESVNNEGKDKFLLII